MYNTAVIGQGLTGLFAAILSAEQGHKTALISKGAGKWLQSTGFMDFTPGSAGDRDMRMKPLESLLDEPAKAVDSFLRMTKEEGYPYRGTLEKTMPVVTGAGHIKQTVLYPPTVSPLLEKAAILVVGFEELIDFQPGQVAENLQREYPDRRITAVKVSLGERSSRGMSQTDAARLLDRKEIRSSVITSLQAVLKERKDFTPDIAVFPASLGLKNWSETVNEFEQALGTSVTEAPGLPPNAGAVRLFQIMRKRAVRLGVRFYENTEVTGSQIDGNAVASLTLQQGVRRQNLQADQIIAATGGILGSGLADSLEGYQETALRLDTDENGLIKDVPENVFLVGAAAGMDKTQYGITGGVYSLVSGYEAVAKISTKRKGGDSRASAEAL